MAYLLGCFGRTVVTNRALRWFEFWRARQASNMKDRYRPADSTQPLLATRTTKGDKTSAGIGFCQLPARSFIG